MPNRSNELLERIKHYGSRVSLKDPRTQLSAASILLVVALIGVFVFSGSDEDTASRVRDSQARATADPTGSTGPEGTTGPRVSGPGRQRSEASVGSSTAPGGPRAAGLPDFGSNARGVTDKEILVGAVYDKSAGGLNSALGIAGVGQIEQKAAYEHLRDYINSHGGIGGRKIRYVYHEFDSLSGQSVETVNQAICNTWTQDNHVFAGLAGGSDTLDDCLNKAGVVQVGGSNNEVSDTKTFREHPLRVDPGTPAIDRMAKFYVDNLHSRGYYSRGRVGEPALPRKVGVVSFDTPVFDRAISALRDALKVHDIPLSEVAQVHQFQTEAEIAETVAGVRAAVLQFKARNVTHVQFLSTSNAFEQLTFWIQADQQQYYPRYGLTSTDGGQALIATMDNAQGKGTSARTFKDSLSVGWFPLFDVPRSDYSGTKETSALRLCKKILSYESFDDPARNAEAIASTYCDGLFYLKAAIEKGGPIVNQKSWLYGVANVGSLSSAGTFDMATTAERHDGMNAIKDLKYHENCNCFHYTSGLKKV